MDISHEPSVLTLDEDPLRILIYGDFGRGKTTLAGTFPRPLIIDTNGGLISIALQGRRPVRFDPNGHEDLESLYFWIKEHSADFDTIVLDTLDNMALQLMGEISEDAVADKRAQGKKVTLRMQFVPEQGDYYANQQQLFRFLNALRRLGKHIVITSSLRVTEGRSAPNVSAGLERVACDFVSIVGELVILDEVDPEDDPDNFGTAPYAGCRVLLTQEANRRATKSRFSSVKPYVIDPTFDKLSTLIADEYARAQEGAE